MPSKKQNRYYPLEKSPLYRMCGSKKFENIVGVQWEKISQLLGDDNYHVWINKKQREIQAPRNWLKFVHKRIGNLLSRIELPDYVYSKKGRSYVDNARFHCGNTCLIKTDITRFYPSITRQAVFRMFLDDFQCSLDIAHSLADICCYKQEHLPTGSPLSGRIAFLAKKRMFDEIVTLVQNHQCKITVYVDDLTISGDGATKKLLGEIRRIIRSHGLRTKGQKSKTYACSKPKKVTGVVIVKDEVRLPNIRHLYIHQARQAVRNATLEDLTRTKRVLSGRLQEASLFLS